MQRILLFATGAYAFGVGGYIWGATEHWYSSVPGVSQTGPLNIHFAKDVALAYLMSGAALLWAGKAADRSAAICGAAWPLLHAMFHIWIWFHRGSPADLIALINVAGLQLPAFLAIYAALSLKTDRT